MCNGNIHYVHCRGCAVLIKAGKLDCEGRCPACEIVEKMLDNEIFPEATAAPVSDEL